MTFTLKPGSGGLMRQFEGTWYVKPDPSGSAGKRPSTIATLRQKIMPLIHGPGLDWIVTGDASVPVSFWTGGFECLLTRRAQSLFCAVSLHLPWIGWPGARQLMKRACLCTGICKRQLGNLVEDLKQEVQRLNEGMPDSVCVS
jgi:hypothetical protein